MLDSCSDGCGWIASIIACLFKGSFAVPMKSEASESVDVDPLVFQTYKTFMFFSISLILNSLFLGKESLVFTPWGIVSGLLWVPGGICGIFGVRNAGLAISQGIWSSIVVFVSFIWGIFVFDEQVRSILNTALAMAILVTGLWGMSYYSSPTYSGYTQPGDESIESSNFIPEASSSMEISSAHVTNIQKKNRQLYGINITQRHLGMMCASINGLCAGSMFVPIHFLKPSIRGMPYSISFGIGAVIVNLSLWLLRYVWNVYLLCSFKAAYHALPPLHFKVIWKSGFTSGALWGVGNVSSIVAVTWLGQGIGYSVIQSSMIISGLWGIFWYHEVTDSKAKVRWFGSAIATVFAIIALGLQHIKNDDDIASRRYVLF